MSLGLNKLEAIELPKPKYVDNNGIERDVELEVTSTSDHRYEFENTTNLIKTYFKKNISEYAPVKAVVGDRFFEWTPFGVGFADEHGNEDWFGRINDAEAEIEDNKVTYKNMLHGIDDEFIVNAGELKHNTILNSMPVYSQKLPGKQISVVVDGIIDFSTDIDMFVDGMLQEDVFETSSEIQFRDSGGDIVFTLPPPIAYEVNGSESILCMYKVIKIESVISLKIFSPYEWIEDASRVYPVAIDPTLIHIGADGYIQRPFDLDVSKNADFIVMPDLSTNKIRILNFNKSNNTFTQLNTDIYPTTSYRCVRFSNNDRHLFFGGAATSSLKAYSYDNNTGNYTLPLALPAPTDYAYEIAFNTKGDYIIYSPGYNLAVYPFNEANGTFGVRASSVSTPYRVTKIQFTNNDRFILTIDDGHRFSLYNFTNGVIGSTIALPAFLSSYSIRDASLSLDNKYIAFAVTASPFIFVCPFDASTGTIGARIQPITLPDVACDRIVFSNRLGYIIVHQGAVSGGKQRLLFYKFDNIAGVIGELITPTSTVKYPNPAASTAATGLMLDRSGEYLFLTQDANNANDSLFIYKFFYEPRDNIYFKDPVSKDYYSDNKGNTLMLIDFGTIVAGQTTSPKKILLENYYDYAVKNIKLSISNPSQEFRVELSESEVPFIPQQTLSFNQTLNTKETIPFYIRVTTTDQSQSGGTFEVLAKCDVV